MKVYIDGHDDHEINAGVTTLSFFLLLINGRLKNELRKYVNLFSERTTFYVGTKKYQDKLDKTTDTQIIIGCTNIISFLFTLVFSDFFSPFFWYIFLIFPVLMRAYPLCYHAIPSFFLIPLLFNLEFFDCKRVYFPVPFSFPL